MNGTNNTNNTNSTSSNSSSNSNSTCPKGCLSCKNNTLGIISCDDICVGKNSPTTTTDVFYDPALQRCMCDFNSKIEEKYSL